MVGTLGDRKEAGEIEDVLTRNTTLGGVMTNTNGCVFLGHGKCMKVNAIVQGRSGEWRGCFFTWGFDVGIDGEDTVQCLVE